MGKQKENCGITLISLIITVIIILVLVAVTINVAINSGLIGKTQEAAEGLKTAHEKESKIKLSNYYNGKILRNKPGLYETGTSTLLKSWDELIEEGLILVTESEYENEMTTFLMVPDSANKAELAGDLVISNEIERLEPSAFEECTALTRCGDSKQCNDNWKLCFLWLHWFDECNNSG